MSKENVISIDPTSKMTTKTVNRLITASHKCQEEGHSDKKYLTWGDWTIIICEECLAPIINKEYKMSAMSDNPFQTKIELSEFMIDNITLLTKTDVPEYDINNWRFVAKALTGKIIVGEREIPIKYIQVIAEINHKYVDEDLLHELFPTPEEYEKLVCGTPITVRTEKEKTTQEYTEKR